jgi:hypothetical protein
MKRSEFLKAITLARSPNFEPKPYLTLDVFFGCALDKERRAVTMHEVASLLSGHCMMLNGEWTSEPESEIETLSKRFDIVG